MPILELQNIVKQFDDNLVVDNINITINKGEFFTLLGPSGCGKTTLIRMIGGFEYPDSGKILLNGNDITYLPPEKRPLNTIFQSYALFPHMTVYDNVAFPLKMLKWDKKSINERVEEVLEDVQLMKYANRYPHELSGGQKQRVAIARSLAKKPQILLLDEPLSALDARLREHMHVELVKLQDETGVTFIYVTHDQSEALALSTRIAVINLGQVEQIDIPQTVYSKPNTYFVADFLGDCNLLAAKVLKIEENLVTLEVASTMTFSITVENASEFSLEQIGWYSIRPEKVKANRIHPQDEELYTIEAAVKGYYYYGDNTCYDFIINEQVKFSALLSNNRPTIANFFEEENNVFVSFNPNSGTFLTK